MKPSEMTNEELAKELIETVGLDGPFCICERCSTVREASARLRKLKIAEVALEKIDNMCDGDMCKFFDDTHHCSACRYLDGCQTGVAHAALAVIRGKGATNGK